MPFERPPGIGALGEKRPEVHAPDRRLGRLVVRQGLLEPTDMTERARETVGRGAERGARGGVRRFGLVLPRRLAPQGVDRQLMVRRQRRPARRQDLETQMMEVQRPDPQRLADLPEERRRRRRPANFRDIALGRDERIEGVEQDADRRREPQAFRAGPGVIEQQRPRRLQLLRQRGLLADRRPVGLLEVRFRIERRGDGAQVDGQFADRLAGDQATSARVGDDRRDQRERDIGEAAGGEQDLDLHRRGEALARKAEHEHHGNERLHAERDGPAAPSRDHAACEGDGPDDGKRGRRPWQRELDG